MNLESLRRASMVMLGASFMFVAGCKTETAPPAPNPPKAPAATTPAKVASTAPSAAPSSAASAAAASPVAAASSSAASPAAVASTSAGSPAAVNPPSGNGGKRKASVVTDAPPPSMAYEDYPEAGVAMAVPENFTDWEHLDNGWWGTMAPDKSLVLLCKDQKWQEWDDVLKATDDLLPAFKAGDEKVTKGKTKDGIEVWYDFGKADLWKEPHAVLIAGYLMEEHDFVMILAWPPDKTDAIKPTAVKILDSIVRMSKYQNKENKETKEE